jgi:hypothetical protein
MHARLDALATDFVDLAESDGSNFADVSNCKYMAKRGSAPFLVAAFETESIGFVPIRGEADLDFGVIRWRTLTGSQNMFSKLDGRESLPMEGTAPGSNFLALDS